MEKRAEVEIMRAEATRYEILPGYLKVVTFVLSICAIGASVFYMFNFSIGGLGLMMFGYSYLLMAFLLPGGFLVLPASRKDMRIRWYDLVAAVLSFGLPFYFFLNAWSIQFIGWIPVTTLRVILGLPLCLLLLELARRTNLVFAGICLVMFCLPLFADRLPGAFEGVGFTFPDLVARICYTAEGVVGLPSRVLGTLLLGFVVFAGILIASGAGTFFLNLALALLGRYRGGPAKVAVVASGFFGSLSGSVISNIAATGSFTIPAMKRMGYPPHYAGAIEACASNGGIIMPPVMGAVAFIMSTLLNMPYATIMIAAFVPAIFYYFGLLIQVDAYAAKAGLRGLPREEIPRLIPTLKKGWVFVFALAFLVWGLVYMRWEALTPWYACGLMLVLSFSSRETMMTPKRIVKTMTVAGLLVIQMAAILIPVGFILCGFLITGASTSLTAGIIRTAGGNVLLLLLMGGVICYIMGCVGVVLASYIILALTMAPAVIEAGALNVLAVHLFIIYWGITGGITPPVAIGSFFAATMAGAPPMKTSVMSMRLGIVLYFIPFYFVFNPSLILQGPVVETLYWFVLGLVGIFLLAEGVEGYFLKLGTLRLYERPLLIIAGLLFAYPEWNTTIIGTALALFTIAIIWLRKKSAPAHSK